VPARHRLLRSLKLHKFLIASEVVSYFNEHNDNY
jgi:hypothetical protein